MLYYITFTARHTIGTDQHGQVTLSDEIDAKRCSCIMIHMVRVVRVLFFDEGE